MLVCALRVWWVHEGNVWPHISSLSVYRSTITRSPMLNMFYIIVFPHDEEDHMNGYLITKSVIITKTGIVTN